MGSRDAETESAREQVRARFPEAMHSIGRLLVASNGDMGVTGFLVTLPLDHLSTRVDAAVG